MPYKLQDLIDVEQFQMLQERLDGIHSFPASIIDNNGNILTATAWQDVCTKFHRRHPECEKECIKSDRYILKHLAAADPAVSYICPHGLVDNALPIIIDGVHYGNFFTGQFFLKEPDLEYFRAQARRYGFDEADYLDAVRKVPVWSGAKRDAYILFIKGLIDVISGVALKNLKEIEAGRLIAASEEKARAALAEKETLLRELYHRTKNNMQIVISLLNLQIAAHPDAALKAALKETQNRVRSMALVHQKLYQAKNLSRIDLAEYVRDLTHLLADSFSGSKPPVRLSLETGEAEVAIETAVSCGLIITELVSNSFHYAFPEPRPDAEIRLRVGRREDGAVTLAVADNGVGLPAGIDVRGGDTLGLSIITSLAGQLDADYAFSGPPGLAFEMTFPAGATAKTG